MYIKLKNDYQNMLIIYIYRSAICSIEKYLKIINYINRILNSKNYRNFWCLCESFSSMIFFNINNFWKQFTNYMHEYYANKQIWHLCVYLILNENKFNFLLKKKWMYET